MYAALSRLALVETTSSKNRMKDSIKYKRQREEMVRQQIAARGITDAKVLAAFRKVPRHLFVSEALRDQAYGDYPLPIGEQQTISQPYIVAEMTQALELNKDDRVLEIGTGSGYQAAILAEVVYRVYTIERIRSLYVQTRNLLDKLHYHSIVMRCSDGTSGWQDESPFDAIMVTAGAPDVPQKLLDQLVEGGAWCCRSAISIPRTSSSTPKMKGASIRRIGRMPL